jgi:hypothetical protein
MKVSYKLYSEERTPATHQIGRWVGPRSGLGVVAKIEKLLSLF